ncbi:MAG TPA: GNAT family N-acetyltransferase [Gaiella sp.]|nr:GNAT family N-acetyltransferase [Gaiella sp.]
MGLELLSAEELSDAELAALFTASYEGYGVPFAIDAAALRFMTEAYDLDRGASRIAVRDGRAVGVANLGLRGTDAWIGGIGVVPDERRRGVGRLLMEAVHDQARARAIERVWLEVIVENAPAVTLYETLGYRRVRDVEVWSVPGAPGPVAKVAVAEARRAIAADRRARDPWQRADDTVDNLDDAIGIASDGAAAVVRLANGRAQLLQAAGPAAGLQTVIRAAAALADSLLVLNVPLDDPMGPVLESLGGAAAVRQHEMVLEL